jgi:hypothetical protein
MITTNKLKESLRTQGICPSQLSKRKGIFTARRGFYYRNGGNATKWRDDISKALDSLGMEYEILDYSEVYLPFRGGAPVSKQSHWFVEFLITSIDSK